MRKELGKTYDPSEIEDRLYADWMFAERGLTQAERDRVPIIRAADAPAAIAGFGVAEQCAAAPGQTMICIRMEQIQTYGGEYYERYER